MLITLYNDMYPEKVMHLPLLRYFSIPISAFSMHPVTKKRSKLAGSTFDVKY